MHLLEQRAANDGITGTVIATAKADYIFIRDDLAGLHRDHAVCHELGHLIAGHIDTVWDGGLASLGASREPDRILHRACDYGEARERQAEQIADLIMERVAHRATPRLPDPSTARIVRGFGDALR